MLKSNSQKNNNSGGIKMNKAGIVYFYCIIMLLMSNLALSQSKDSESVSEINNKFNSDSYYYNAQGRADPFKPFVTQKSASGPDPNEIIDEKTQLAGMQLFEPGQLSLVGVITSSREPIALVEDQTKKGYILKLGNLIGKRGVVSSIDKHQLVVTETAKTRSGQELKTTTTMRMKKEGDE